MSDDYKEVWASDLLEVYTKISKKCPGQVDFLIKDPKKLIKDLDYSVQIHRDDMTPLSGKDIKIAEELVMAGIFLYHNFIYKLDPVNFGKIILQIEDRLA